MLVKDFKSKCMQLELLGTEVYEDCGIAKVKCTVGTMMVVLYVDIKDKDEEGVVENTIAVVEPRLSGRIDNFIKAVELVRNIRMRDDVRHEIVLDILRYRENNIKQFNEDLDKATDKLSFTHFLRFYNIAINVFNLHDEYSCKGSFNRFISVSYDTIAMDSNWKL